MRTFKHYLSAGIVLLAYINVEAQDELYKNRSIDSLGYNVFMAGIETSKTSYIDSKTKDSSSVAPFVALHVDFHHKSNLGFRAKTYVLAKGSNSGFYLTSLSVYYADYNKRLIPIISYTRFLDHSNPSIPYSPISNEIFGQLRYVNPVLEPAAGIDVGFGNDKENNDKSVSDVNVFASVSHWFQLNKSSGTSFVFVPSLQLNAGTDRYFKFLRSTRYISQNRSIKTLSHGRGGNGSQGGGGNGNGGDNGTTSEDVTYIINEVNDFNLSNVELNGFIRLSLGRVHIEPSGSLYFPLRGDDRSAYGYWQLNLNYLF